MRTLFALLLASSALLTVEGCAIQRDGVDDEGDLRDDEGRFSSKEATLLDFEFDGELLTDSAWSAKARINDQLLYTIGHLNGNRSVGRLDRLELTDVTTAAAEGGLTRVTYHAKMPVAWGSKTNLPQTYQLTLPKKASYSGFAEFTEKYSHTCVDGGAHDVDAGSMWYYYRPARSGCSIDPSLVVKVTAKVTRSALNTTSKYPEYHKVWEDGALEVVAVFGKYEDNATSNGDAGIAAYNKFVSAVARELAPLSLATTPATLPSAAGVATPEVTFEATLADGKKVKIVALLVDNVRTAGAAFDARYEQLSTTADLIAYNGHAGLGDNVRALARKGRFVSGKYLITFMNGCDTFAYVDGALAETRAKLNPDDAAGTKYLEIVTNAMPAYFSSMPTASISLIRGLMKHDKPMTYDEMFAGVDRQQIIVVTGEEDNVFTPGMPIHDGTGGEPTEWKGLDASGTVLKGEEQAFDTGAVPAGSYTFQLSGTGGDADLYVKVGAAPTTRLYDCRPYKSGSNETCTVNVATESTVHMMVRGWAATSTFTLVGKKS